ncbi:hypothetical protein DMENIID0001_071970 [Sergentomyia squamirostris]
MPSSSSSPSDKLTPVCHQQTPDEPPVSVSETPFSPYPSSLKIPYSCGGRNQEQALSAIDETLPVSLVL